MRDEETPHRTGLGIAPHDVARETGADEDGIRIGVDLEKEVWPIWCRRGRVHTPASSPNSRQGRSLRKARRV